MQIRGTSQTRQIQPVQNFYPAMINQRRNMLGVFADSNVVLDDVELPILIYQHKKLFLSKLTQRNSNSLPFTILDRFQGEIADTWFLPLDGLIGFEKSNSIIVNTSLSF